MAWCHRENYVTNITKPNNEKYTGEQSSNSLENSQTLTVNDLGSCREMGQDCNDRTFKTTCFRRKE